MCIVCSALQVVLIHSYKNVLYIVTEYCLKGQVLSYTVNRLEVILDLPYIPDCIPVRGDS